MRTPVSILTVTAPQEFLAALTPALADLQSAGVIAEVVRTPGDSPTFQVAVTE